MNIKSYIDRYTFTFNGQMPHMVENDLITVKHRNFDSIWLLFIMENETYIMSV